MRHFSRTALRSEIQAAGASEGREALGTAGQETGATILAGGENCGLVFFSMLKKGEVCGQPDRLTMRLTGNRT